MSRGPPKKRFKYDPAEGLMLEIQNLVKPEDGSVVTASVVPEFEVEVVKENTGETDDDGGWITPLAKHCSACFQPGEIVYCDTCGASFHVKCLATDAKKFPELFLKKGELAKRMEAERRHLVGKSRKKSTDSLISRDDDGVPRTSNGAKAVSTRRTSKEGSTGKDKVGPSTLPSREVDDNAGTSADDEEDDDEYDSESDQDFMCNRCKHLRSDQRREFKEALVKAPTVRTSAQITAMRRKIELRNNREAIKYHINCHLYKKKWKKAAREAGLVGSDCEFDPNEDADNCEKEDDDVDGGGDDDNDDDYGDDGDDESDDDEDEEEEEEEDDDDEEEMGGPINFRRSSNDSNGDETDESNGVPPLPPMIAFDSFPVAQDFVGDKKDDDDDVEMDDNVAAEVGNSEGRKRSWAASADVPMDVSDDVVRRPSEGPDGDPQTSNVEMKMSIVEKEQGSTAEPSSRVVPEAEQVQGQPKETDGAGARRKIETSQEKEAKTETKKEVQNSDDDDDMHDDSDDDGDENDEVGRSITKMLLIAAKAIAKTNPVAYETVRGVGIGGDGVDDEDDGCFDRRPFFYEEVCDGCGILNKTTKMVQCDLCGSKFHGDCSLDSFIKPPPRPWLCPRHSALQLINEKYCGGDAPGPVKMAAFNRLCPHGEVKDVLDIVRQMAYRVLTDRSLRMFQKIAVEETLRLRGVPLANKYPLWAPNTTNSTKSFQPSYREMQGVLSLLQLAQGDVEKIEPLVKKHDERATTSKIATRGRRASLPPKPAIPWFSDVYEPCVQLRQISVKLEAKDDDVSEHRTEREKSSEKKKKAKKVAKRSSTSTSTKKGRKSESEDDDVRGLQLDKKLLTPNPQPSETGTSPIEEPIKEQMAQHRLKCEQLYARNRLLSKILQHDDDVEPHLRFVLSIRSDVHGASISTRRPTVAKEWRRRRATEMEESGVFIGYGGGVAPSLSSSLESYAVLMRAPAVEPANYFDVPSQLRDVVVSSGRAPIAGNGFVSWPLPDQPQHHVAFAFDYAFDDDEQREDFWVSSMAIWSRTDFFTLRREELMDPVRVVAPFSSRRKRRQTNLKADDKKVLKTVGRLLNELVSNVEKQEAEQKLMAARNVSEPAVSPEYNAIDDDKTTAKENVQQPKREVEVNAPDENHVAELRFPESAQPQHQHQHIDQQLPEHEPSFGLEQESEEPSPTPCGSSTSVRASETTDEAELSTTGSYYRDENLDEEVDEDAIEQLRTKSDDESDEEERLRLAQAQIERDMDEELKHDDEVEADEQWTSERIAHLQRLVESKHFETGSRPHKVFVVTENAYPSAESDASSTASTSTSTSLRRGANTGCSTWDPIQQNTFASADASCVVLEVTREEMDRLIAGDSTSNFDMARQDSTDVDVVASVDITNHANSESSMSPSKNNEERANGIEPTSSSSVSENSDEDEEEEEDSETDDEDTTPQVPISYIIKGDYPELIVDVVGDGGDDIDAVLNRLATGADGRLADVSDQKPQEETTAVGEVLGKVAEPEACLAPTTNTGVRQTQDEEVDQKPGSPPKPEPEVVLLDDDDDNVVVLEERLVVTPKPEEVQNVVEEKQEEKTKLKEEDEVKEEGDAGTEKVILVVNEIDSEKAEEDETIKDEEQINETERKEEKFDKERSFENEKEDNESLVEDRPQSLLNATRSPSLMSLDSSGPLCYEPSPLRDFGDDVHMSGPLEFTTTVTTTVTRRRGTRGRGSRPRTRGSACRGRANGDVGVERVSPKAASPRGTRGTRGTSRGRRGGRLAKTQRTAGDAEDEKYLRQISEETAKKEKEARERVRLDSVEFVINSWLQNTKDVYFRHRDDLLTAFGDGRKTAAGRTADEFMRVTFQRNRFFLPFEHRFFLPEVTVCGYVKVLGRRFGLPFAIQRAVTKIGCARDCHIQLDRVAPQCSVFRKYHCDVIFDKWQSTFVLSTVGTSRAVVDGQPLQRCIDDLDTRCDVVVLPPDDGGIGEADLQRIADKHRDPNFCVCRLRPSPKPVTFEQMERCRAGVVRLRSGAKIRIGCALLEFFTPMTEGRGVDFPDLRQTHVLGAEKTI